MGQIRSAGDARVMSAFPPDSDQIADITLRRRREIYPTKCAAAKRLLFDHLVGAKQD